MAGLGTFSNGGLGFGLAFTLEDHFSGVADDINKSLDGLSEATESTVNRVNNALKVMAIGAALVGAGGAVLSFFGKASDIRAEYQAYEVQFETLLQSKQRAADMMAAIKLDAADNPVMGAKSLVAANAALLGTGNIMEEQSRRITNNLANIIAGVGRGDEELSRMSVNLAGIASLGKAQSMDIKQFIAAGIPIYKILADGLGKTENEIKEMDITVDQLDKAFQKASESGGQFSGALERAAQSTKGLKAAAEDARELIMERIGAAIEPYTRRLYGLLNMTLEKMKEFIASPIGQKIVGLVAVSAALAVVLGTILILLGGLQIMWIAVTKRMATATVGTLAHTFATKGLVAAMRQLAASTWALLAPYMLIIALTALYVGVLYKLYQMMRSGNETTMRMGVVLTGIIAPLAVVIALWYGLAWPLALIAGAIVILVSLVGGLMAGFENLNKPIKEMQTGGVIGFFTKFAAILEMVQQIWDSWNGDEFTLTEDLYKKLDALGILPMAEKIGLVIVRIKQFFLGLAAGFTPVKRVLQDLWQIIKVRLLGIWDQLVESFGGAWVAFKMAFGPMAAMLEKLYQKFFGTEQSLSAWAVAGKIVGTILLVIFKAFVDVLRIVIWILAEIIMWLIRLGTTIFQVVMIGITYFKFMWNTAMEWGGAFFSWMWNLPLRMIAWGINFVTNILTGIQTMWASLVAWVDGAVTSLADKIAGKIGQAINFVKTGGGLWGDENEPNGNPIAPTGGGNPLTAPVRGGTPFHTVTSKSPARVAGGAGMMPSTGNAGQPIILQTILDGNLISEKVMENQTFKNSRNK